MRHALPALLLLASTMLSSASPARAAHPVPTSPPPESAEAGPAEAKHLVRVYYFYTTRRCASCRKIEALTDEAIRERFASEVGAGTLEWLPVNIDEPANKHFVADYKLYTKSVVVVDMVDGKASRWKNLEKIWELLRDGTAFRQYVQREVREYVEGAS